MLMTVEEKIKQPEQACLAAEDKYTPGSSKMILDRTLRYLYSLLLRAIPER